VIEQQWVDLERAIRAEDAQLAIDLCIAADERDRNALFERVDALELERVHDGKFPHVVGGSARAAARGALAPKPTLRWVGQEVDGRWADIVASRPPAWRERWAAQVLRERWGSPAFYGYLRLRRDGICERTCGPELPEAWMRHLREPAEDLREYDELRESVFWLVLEHAVPLPDWHRQGFVAAVAEGLLARDRLLDAILDALARDFEPRAARTYVSLHDALEPTPGERAAREAGYVRLLDAAEPRTVALALAGLSAIEAAGGTHGRAVLDRLGAALALPARVQAKRALKLLAAIAKREPALASEAMELAAEALVHEAADVQAAAVKLLERGDLDPALRARLAEIDVDPSLRPRLTALAGKAAPAAPRVAAVEVPAPVPIEPATVPRLTVNAPLEPVAGLDELLDLAAVLAATRGTADDFERLLDGASRLCDRPVPEARRRALKKAAYLSDETARISAKRPVIHKLAEPHADWRPPLGAALGRRIGDVLRRIGDGEPAPLLSFPTHRGGFIDARVLVERVRNARVVDDDDLAQALLRIAPEHRDEARARLNDVPGQPAAALRAALGDPVEREPGALPASWDAVDVLAGAPVGLVRKPVPGDWHGPWTPEHSPLALAPSRFMEVAWDYGRFDPDQVRWLSIVRPGDRELFYAAVVYICGADLGGWTLKEPDRLIATAIEPLLDPDEALTPSAYALLVTALGDTKALRTLASDVVIEAIRTRRLEPCVLGGALAGALTRDGAVPARWADALGSAALAGPLHAYELQLVLEAMFAALDDARPGGMTALVDLLRRLAQDADARIAERAWLEGVPPRSKTGALARAALAVSGDGGARSVEAAAAAEEGRHERELRWSGA
jgi:hypothetical protein